MRLPIDIEELLSGHAVENDRLEYKTGWNPDAIYRTICAFANDFDETGGGYIVIGVKEKNGHAVRPVVGIDPNLIEPIEKDMVGFNNLMVPYYQPRLYIENVDGKTILIIKVSPGERRPYKIPEQVTAKQKAYNYYIRYNSSSIVPKGEYERELMDLANRTPFDDRGNDQIKMSDISPLLLHEYLVAAKSSLAELSLTDNMESVLEQMDLLEPVPEGWWIKNVAAMMFSENPSRFFKQAQIDIVLFPEGREKNPNNMIEVPPIKGSVPMMLKETLSYLRTNVVKQLIEKRKDNEKSDKCFNYPYQALEEAVVNSLYHRDWTIREPVEITIEPDKISILSFSGPNHTISMESIRKGKSLRSRRYRNRRLGEFLKELDYTEGRATGIPTIQEELLANGSPQATIETDEERTYFLIDIPCHPKFIKKQSTTSKKKIEIDLNDLSERQKLILAIITEFPSLSAKGISEKISEKASEKTSEKTSEKIVVTDRTIETDLARLKKLGILVREGGRKEGRWVIAKSL